MLRSVTYASLSRHIEPGATALQPLPGICVPPAEGAEPDQSTESRTEHIQRLQSKIFGSTRILSFPIFLLNLHKRLRREFGFVPDIWRVSRVRKAVDTFGSLLKGDGGVILNILWSLVDADRFEVYGLLVQRGHLLSVCQSASHPITSGGLHFAFPGRLGMLPRDEDWAHLKTLDRQAAGQSAMPPQDPKVETARYSGNLRRGFAFASVRIRHRLQWTDALGRGGWVQSWPGCIVLERLLRDERQHLPLESVVLLASLPKDDGACLAY